MPTHCRRPYCAVPFTTPEKRDAHESDATKHRRPEQQADPKFLCDWEGHADAIEEAGFCPVCQ